MPRRFAKLVSHTHSRSTAVMAVGNIHYRHVLKQTGQLGDLHQVLHHIQCVLHAVLRRKIIYRLFGSHQAQNISIDLGLALIS